METITIPYTSKETILEEVKKVIKYPCSIGVRWITGDYDSGIRVWNTSAWLSTSSSYLESSLQLDNHMFDRILKKSDKCEVVMHVPTLEEYKKAVLRRGGKMSVEVEGQSHKDFTTPTEEFIEMIYTETRKINN